MENRGLWAPESYWKLSNNEKYEITNGCGPARAMGLVPNSILGVDLKPACDIHDYTYARPNSMYDRKDADDLLLMNMHKLMTQKLSPGLMQPIGIIGVGLYYVAVRLFGGVFFDKQQ